MNGLRPIKRPELSGDVTKLQGQLPDAEWKGKRDALSIISIGERALASLLVVGRPPVKGTWKRSFLYYFLYCSSPNPLVDSGAVLQLRWVRRSGSFCVSALEAVGS
ncbi:hypothetical protein CDAR_61221 [Caerostris darwini]|uniref:Uncharacterized protein n=1 Tax=Caerostris darwini TaxID=1538125 RepID=A0AAV4V4H5_9ARAC|nr:hypothetical protein CDAR_61221 [Caerostris darwini]